MTPEEALNNLTQLAYYYADDDEHILNNAKSYYELIQKALNRLEEIDDTIAYGGGVYAQDGVIAKKLKALEILKYTLGIKLFETTEDNTLGETHYYIEIGGVVSYKLKEKEDYDLLKEVLL